MNHLPDLYDPDRSCATGAAGKILPPKDLPWPTGFFGADYTLPPLSKKQEVIGAHRLIFHRGRPQRMQGRINHQNAEALVQPGHFTLWKVGDAIDVSWQEPHSFYCLWLEPTMLEEMFPGGEKVVLLPRLSVRDERMRGLISHVEALGRTRPTATRIEVQSLAASVLLHLVETHSTTPRRWMRQRLSAQQLRRVSSFVAENLEADLSLPDLAREANLSAFHFSRVFRRTTQMSPWQFVLAHKLERAWQLVQRRTLSLSEIAFQLRFSDQAHFSRSFSRQFGLTPMAARTAG